METFTKIKYTPLKYKAEKKNLSIQKESILNTIGINKYKYQDLHRNYSYNSNHMILPNNINNNYNNNNYKK